MNAPNIPWFVVSANVSPAKRRQGLVPSATFPVLNSSMGMNDSTPNEKEKETHKVTVAKECWTSLLSQILGILKCRILKRNTHIFEGF
jgi:hypothetical protein